MAEPVNTIKANMHGLTIIYYGDQGPSGSKSGQKEKGMVIKESKLRGVMSKGMLLAEDEMGLTDDHAGIMILPSKLDPGTPLSLQASGFDPLSLSDLVFDLSITPNRPDWASVLGVARKEL